MESNQVQANNEDHEQVWLLRSLGSPMVMKVKTSEPRDALQSERSCLAFIRFGNTLFFTGLGILFNFKFQTSNNSNLPLEPPDSRKKFSTVVSFILIFLALGILLIGCINYFSTIQGYAHGKIKVKGFNNIVTTILMIVVVLTLIGVSISLILEGYISNS